MKFSVTFAPVILLFLAGCFSGNQSFNTLRDYRQAFEPPPEVRLGEHQYLTLDRALNIALRNNPTVHSAACAIEAAKYNYYCAMSSYLPRIDVSGSSEYEITNAYNRHDPPPGVLKRNNHLTSDMTLQASWLLFDGLARELDLRLAKLEYDTETFSDKNIRRLLKRAVSYAYWDILLATEEIGIAEADKAFQQAALKQAESRFRSGHVPYAAVLNFKILEAEAESSISSAAYQRSTALHALAALLGYSRRDFPETTVFQKLSLTGVPAIPDQELCLELAIIHRPDLQMQKIQIETALRQRQKVYSEFLPHIQLYSAYSLKSFAARYSGSPYSGAYYNQDKYAIGITGTWNIFDGFDSINRLQVRKSLEKSAFFGLNRQYLEITSEIKDAYSNYLNTVQQIKIYQSTVKWVNEQRELVYTEYINGRETITRVNETQSKVVETQKRLALWQVQAQKAAAQLNAAVGTDVFKRISGE